MDTVLRYHVTTLSNFLIGFDKYSRKYSKGGIAQSTYPNIFFLLKKNQLQIGIEKAQKLLAKLDKTHDKLLFIRSDISSNELSLNTVTPTGLGEFVKRNWVNVSALYYMEKGDLQSVSIEEAIATAYQTLGSITEKYSDLRPRSISILPIAKSCQANCLFCFSSSSISSDQSQNKISSDRIEFTLQQAALAGSERAVITGGGEPGLLYPDELTKLISTCKRYFDKTVLITNGYFLTKKDDVRHALYDLNSAGLSILSISRHHYNAKINARLMNLEIDIEKINSAYIPLKEAIPYFSIRYVCVLQKGGIDTEESLQAYIDWAFECGIEQICFKELYVSSSTESLYFDSAANQWSFKHQVPLSLITHYAEEKNWLHTSKLPWGSPIYRIKKNGRSMTLAAYTEPSVSWEMHNGLCRSWNLMSDGSCYASLETSESEVLKQESVEDGLRKVP